jgi:hypothetical protein
MATGVEKLVLTNCNGVAFSTDEKCLGAVFGVRDGGGGGGLDIVRVYTLATGRELAITNEFGTLAFSPDGQLLAIVRQSV